MDNEANRAFLRAQAQCLAYALPPSAVVYESNAKAAEALLAYPDFSPVPYDSDEPQCPPVAVRHNVSLEQYVRLLREPIAVDSHTAFLHERTSAGGKRALVAFGVRGNADSTVMFANVVSITPGTDDVPSRLVETEDPLGETFWGGSDVYFLGHTLQRRALRLYAGQPDAADPSHFTVAYEATYPLAPKPSHGVVEGWLQDDGQVLMRRRHLHDPGAPTSMLEGERHRQEANDQAARVVRLAADRDWDRLESESGSRCQAQGNEAWQIIDAIDTTPYLYTVREMIGHGVAIALEKGLPAVYVEFDPENHYQASARGCGLVSVDWSDWQLSDACSRGPRFRPFFELGAAEMENPRAASAASQFILARTLAAIGRAADAVNVQGLTIYAGRHDDYDSIVAVR